MKNVVDALIDALDEIKSEHNGIVRIMDELGNKATDEMAEREHRLYEAICYLENAIEFMEGL